jgi:putative component of membrane protein insertase Oxa1/YidC/SpoIIIJ protein YidD
MRFTPKQQTLAITLASVLFLGSIPAIDASIPTNNLAWQLYQEGDWQHARIEAQRQQLEKTDDPALDQAIALLAAQRIASDGTAMANTLKAWLATNTTHTARNWVLSEFDIISNSRTSSRKRIPVTARFAHLIIGFYQHQIAPAIGHRCSMHPSCSRYSLQACREYGPLGIPMTTDRLIRESDHVRYRINPIQSGDRELYHDPVSDHTFWLRRYRP